MLELKNVSVSAGGEDGEIEIIYNVSLTLEDKKIYVVTGPNGGGKTSLAKAIMGIYPVRCGSMMLDGVDITAKSITERANMGVGYAFQAPTRFKGLKVRDFLSLAMFGSQERASGSGATQSGGMQSGGMQSGGTQSGGTQSGGTQSGGMQSGETQSGGTQSGGTQSAATQAGAMRGSAAAARDDEEQKLCSLLVDVGLCAQDYIDRELNASFSGGELKRVEIASILARELRVALFDEPEAGIDLWSFQKLTETFIRLNETSDTTIVIISHQERILRLADEVILIADGKISEITSPDKILGELVVENPDCVCPTCHDRRRSAAQQKTRARKGTVKHNV